MPFEWDRQAVILLADDDEAARGSIIEALGRRSFDFFEADRGLEAVRIARSRRIDLSILDVEMPDLSGLEVLRLIHRFNASLPCILVSAACTKELAAQALDAGAYTLLDKPLSINVLRYTVEMVINKR